MIAGRVILDLQQRRNQWEREGKEMILQELRRRLLISFGYDLRDYLFIKFNALWKFSIFRYFLIFRNLRAINFETYGRNPHFRRTEEKNSKKWIRKWRKWISQRVPFSLLPNDLVLDRMHLHLPMEEEEEEMEWWEEEWMKAIIIMYVLSHWINWLTDSRLAIGLTQRREIYECVIDLISFQWPSSTVHLTASSPSRITPTPHSSSDSNSSPPTSRGILVFLSDHISLLVDYIWRGE